MTIAIRNLTRGSVLASQAELAGTLLSRGIGLMGRRALPEGGGLIIAPCNNIHMFFMRFAIDAVFINRRNVVVGLRPRLRPWLSMAICLPARHTLELPAGTIAASGTQIGDQLEIIPAIA